MPEWLLVSDVDDTLLGDEAGLAKLAQALQNGPASLAVAYNSSRPCASLRRTLAASPALPTPDYLIGALGTEIEEGASGQPLAGYGQHLSRGWYRRRIAAIMEEMGFTAHAPEYQTPFKASFDAPHSDTYPQVVHRLQAEGLPAKVIYSGGKNLDLIPLSAGKGAVIEYLRRRLAVLPEQVVVAGDSGNDLEMFVPPYRGIIVANAHPELKACRGDHIYQARLGHAWGVLEGLRHWNVL